MNRAVAALLPRLRLTEAEFVSLRQHNRTPPKARTPGLRWKARRPAGWFIGEYDASGSVTWYRPVVLCARQKPEPSSLVGAISPGFDAALKRANHPSRRHARGRNTAGR